MASSKLLFLFAAPLVFSSLASSHERFLGQRDLVEHPCGPMGKVMEKVSGYSKQPLRGALTGNRPFGNHSSEPHLDAPLLNRTPPLIPSSYRVYGENQTAIKSPQDHCTTQANHYLESDFQVAWKFLSCDLERLFKNPVVASAFENAVQGLEQLVENADNPPATYANPWIGATPDNFTEFFHEYFQFLPEPTGDHSGLEYILKENYFERNNPAAIYFLNNFKSMTGPAKEYTTEVFDWTYRWVTARGLFMDSAYSRKVIPAWVEYNNNNTQALNANVNMSAYKGYNASDTKGYGYKSFNEFFSRTFKKPDVSRPVTQPDSKMVVTAPGDVEINFIYSKLRVETKIPVKGIHTMNIKELLAGSEHASRFVGGTAVSAVLMPYAYHNFHSPVSGELIEAVDVPGVLFGIPEGTAWFGSGNTGSPTSNFNIFGGFHRAYYIYDTGEYGLVAQIAVGLADVSTICGSVGTHVGWVDPGSCCGTAAVNCDAKKPRCENRTKGEHVGYFAYGGSLNILLFEANVFNSMNVLMGDRIGSMTEITA